MGNSYCSHAQTCPWWTEASKARTVEVVSILIRLALIAGSFVVVAWFPGSFGVVAWFPGSLVVVALFPGSLVVVALVTGSSETIEISSDFNFTQYISNSWGKTASGKDWQKTKPRKGNLNNTCNHLHFLSCHVRGDCPPFLFRFWIGFSVTGETFVLCTREQVKKKKKKLLECDRVFSVTIFVGDTLPPSRTRQFLGAFNWNAENTMVRELWRHAFRKRSKRRMNLHR